MEEVSFAVNDHFEDFIFNWDYKDYFLVGGYGSSKMINANLDLVTEEQKLRIDKLKGGVKKFSGDDKNNNITIKVVRASEQNGRS